MASSPVQTEPRVTPAAPGPAGRPSIWRSASPRYWVCLGVLALAVAGLGSLSRWAGWVLRKEAVPLKRPLAQFDGRKLGARFEVNRDLTDRIPPMSEDTIDSLGTHEFIRVFITDRDKLPADPTRNAQVFVTYYTGKPDLVPHVPDECYLAGGYQKVGEATVELPVRGVGAPGDRLPVRVLEFEAPRHGLGTATVDRTTVMYFFHANGGYETTRNGVRRSMMDPTLRYAYYAKIEVTYGDSLSSRAERQASIEALGPLMERVLPILISDHFDLDKFHSGQRDPGDRKPGADVGHRVSAGGPRVVAAGVAWRGNTTPAWALSVAAWSKSPRRE